MKETAQLKKNSGTDSAIITNSSVIIKYRWRIILITLSIILFSFNLIPFGCSDGLLDAQSVAINTTGNVANASAVLDLDANNKGILIPRVSLLSATDVLTIASPAVSLLVYNTSTSGTPPDNVVPGFFYWNGTKWLSFGSQTTPGSTMPFADFYALMPPDNSATVAAGTAVSFPNLGPTSGSDITKLDSTRFQLSAIGTYMVSWQVSVNEAGQLVLELNGTENLTTVVGRATGTSQITGTRLITTTVANTVLRVVNPLGSATALTITPTAGGARPVSASLVITRIQ
jgi:hypothetical protein